MADASMTREFDNPLYDKLKYRFKDRGIHRVNASAKPVDAGDIDADVKIAHLNVGRTLSAIADPYDHATYGPAGAETRMFELVGEQTGTRTVPKSTAEKLTQIRIEAYNKVTPFKSGAYSYAYRRAAAIRSKAVYETAKMREVQSRQKAAPVKKKTMRKTLDVSKIFSKGFWSGMWKELTRPDGSGEREIASPKLKVSVIIGIAIAFCILIILIYSFSQISQIKNEITGLDREKEVLCDEIRDLKLELDAKNDVQLLEKRAEDLGMVKSNKVTTKYINLASGEHIEVVGGENAAEDGESGVFSTMLSTVSSNLDNLFDYFN